VLPRDLTPIVEEIPEMQAALYQIIRFERQMDVLKLRMGYDPKSLKKGESELAGRVHEILTSRLAIAVEIELVCDAELLKLGPPHKIPRVAKK
jgi:phenylacetate-CoA ligase